MDHGDPLLWWRLDPQAKAAALGYLGAIGEERQEQQRRRKGKGRSGDSGPYMGIPGLEVEPR